MVAAEFLTDQVTGATGGLQLAGHAGSVSCLGIGGKLGRAGAAWGLIWSFGASHGEAINQNPEPFSDLPPTWHQRRAELDAPPSASR